MKFVKSLILILAISGLVVFFQNCGVQQKTGLLGARDSASSTVDPVAVSAPFAYDLVVDTISYNSCVGDGLNLSGVHGLKVGVNEGFVDSLATGAVKGGLKLRSEFLQHVVKNVKPSYPSTVITPAQVKNVILNSPINKDVHAQIAVRRASDLFPIQDIIQFTPEAEFSRPRDGIVLEPSLFSDNVLTNLTKSVQFSSSGLVLSEGPRIYNLNSNSVPTPIEASFGYNSITDSSFPMENPQTDNTGIGERYAENVRNRFNLGTAEKFILAITYGADETEDDRALRTPKRKDDKEKSKAYGRGFALQFGLPVSPVAAGWKNTTLKSVTETNLSDANPVDGVQWECRNYLIMKKNHWNNKKFTEPACIALNADDLTDLKQPGNVQLAKVTLAQVKNIRRHYLEDSWDVGLFYEGNKAYDPATRLEVSPGVRRKLCLVPKGETAECYLPTEGLVEGTDVGVNYNPGSECFLSNRFGTSYTASLDVVKAGGRCAQFASICIRRSDNF